MKAPTLARRSRRSAFRFTLFPLLPWLLFAFAAQAKYLGADPYCPCEDCGQPSNRAEAEGSVSLSEGNLGYRQAVTSLRSASGVTAGLQLVYNSYNADGSRAQVDTGLGYGWTHSWNVFLFRQRSHLFRFGADGRITKYTLGPGGAYSSAPGHFETLVAHPDGSFTLLQKDQTSYRFGAVPGTPFLVAGPVWRLLSMTDRNGNTTLLTYVDGLLTVITDTYGRQLRLGYDAARRLVSLTDPSNRTTVLAYDPSGRRLVQVRNPQGGVTRYAYNTSYQLTQVTDPDGRRFTYQYSGLNPVGITDSTGQTYFRLSNPGGWATDNTTLALRMERVYLPATTTRADGRGNPWRYQYDARGYLTRIVAPDGAATTYSYDPSNLRLAAVTDANSQTTRYEYDAMGNRVRVIDALGHPTAYTYEPTFQQVTSVTDPNGRITTYQYDAAGNRTRETQAVGLPEERTRTWTYDTRGNALTATDWRGHTTVYTYDAHGNRASMTEAAGTPEQRTTAYLYDATGNHLQTIDPLGRTTTYQYDALDRLVRVTDALGQSTRFTYDHRGNRIAVTDRHGHVSTFAYDSRNRLVRSTDPLGQIERYTYDANGNRTSVTDRNGHTTASVYDSRDRLVRTLDPLGHTTRYAYDAVGNLLQETDARGHATRYHYDALHRRVSRTAPDGGLTTFTYASVAAPCCTPALGSSLPSSETDPLGRRTCFKYDSLDRLTTHARKQSDDDCQVEDGDDAIARYTYDAGDNRLTLTEPNGNVTTYTYDSLDRPATRLDAAGDLTRHVYDPVGNPVNLILPNGNLVESTYDALNRLVLVIDREGPLRAHAYDAEGLRLADTDGNGHTTSYTYDSLHRLTEVTDPMGGVSRYQYDPVGNLVRTEDRQGVPTTYAYDASNRRIEACEAVGTPVQRCTRFAYDSVGNLVQVTDPHAQVTTYAYDALNRRVQETHPDAAPNTRTFAYDLVGNLVRRTDQQGRTTVYEYSDLDFLLIRDYPDGPDDHFNYDLSGRMLSAERGGWLVTFDYDGANRLVFSAQNGRSIAYSRDIPGRTLAMSYPGGRTVTESYDYRNRPLSIDDAASPPALATYAYDAGNRVLTRAYRNGTLATYRHNPNNWLDSVEHNLGAGLIAGFRYRYDLEGNKRCEEHLHQPTRSEAYAYDSLHRLVSYRVGLPDASCSVPFPDTQTAYQLDPLGNWTSRTIDGSSEFRTHGPANEILTIDGLPYEHDDRGNLDRDPRFSYLYDDENRLTGVLRLADGRLVAQYLYDALGRRVAKTTDPDPVVSDPRTTLHFYDDARIIEEQDPAGATLATYVYGIYVDEVLVMERGAGTFYYHQNSLYHTAALTDAGGHPVERVTYDPYGSPRITDGLFVPVPPNSWGTAHSAVGNSILFTGRELDEETGLYFFRARSVDPNLGRFLQRDPAGPADSLNLHEYLQSRPTHFVDPTGMRIAEILTEVDWYVANQRTAFSAATWWYRGFSKNIARVNVEYDANKSPCCCVVQPVDDSDASSPPVQIGNRQPGWLGVWTQTHTWDTKAKYLLSSDEPRCGGCPGVFIEVYHVFSTEQTAEVTVTGGIGVEIGKEPAKLTATLGGEFKFGPSKELSKHRFFFLACPRRIADRECTVSVHLLREEGHQQGLENPNHFAKDTDWSVRWAAP